MIYNNINPSKFSFYSNFSCLAFVAVVMGAPTIWSHFFAPKLRWNFEFCFQAREVASSLGS